MGVYAAMSVGGAAVGMLAGGLLVTYLSWRWVLFVNVPVGAIVAALATRGLAASARQARGRPQRRQPACRSCDRRRASWRQTHVAGPINLRTAPLPERNYVGEYQRLAALRGRGFAAIFTLPAPQARSGPTDIFFARIGPG
jgi:MFS family permease